MTRRERAIARLERRREWAAGRRDKAAAGFAGVERICSMIPLGQPILVGHHSERHARRDQSRIQNGMQRACENQDMAKHHESKAAGIAAQLANTVFSDDPDAIEALQAKIDSERAVVERMKSVNKIVRKAPKNLWTTDKQIALESIGLLAGQIKRLFEPDFCGRIGFASYELTNRGANIRRMEKRIEEIKRRNATAENAEEAGGVIIEGTSDYACVTFSEKPDREILNDLRAAGFRWGGGSWIGRRENIPASVIEMQEENHE